MLSAKHDPKAHRANATLRRSLVRPLTLICLIVLIGVILPVWLGSTPPNASAWSASNLFQNSDFETGALSPFTQSAGPPGAAFINTNANRSPGGQYNLQINGVGQNVTFLHMDTDQEKLLLVGTTLSRPGDHRTGRVLQRQAIGSQAMRVWQGMPRFSITEVRMGCPTMFGMCTMVKVILAARPAQGQTGGARKTYGTPPGEPLRHFRYLRYISEMAAMQVNGIG